MLDAYHATGDGYYYDRAVETARILIRGQLPCGGWDYKFDLAGAASEKKWYRTIGKNAWGMGEHGFYYGNATYDDNVTAGALDFLIRIYLEKLDPQFKPAVEKGIDMLLDSQLESGGWPQRWPLMDCHPNSDGTPDYSSCTTFNDNVTVNNIDLLLKAYFVVPGHGLCQKPPAGIPLIGMGGPVLQRRHSGQGQRFRTRRGIHDTYKGQHTETHRILLSDR